MKLLKICLTLFLTLILFSCTEEEEVGPDKIFDPAVIGGRTSSNPKIHDVLGLSAVITHESVKLEWINPSIYEGLDYEIYIYRTVGTLEESILPDVTTLASGAFLFYPKLTFTPLETITYLDHNDENNVALYPEDTYTYHVYVKKGDFYSSGATLEVTIPTLEDTINIPNPSDFWKEITSQVGSAPSDPSGDINQTTFKSEISYPEFGGVQIAYAKNGNIKYQSDPLHNRVMISINAIGMQCYRDYSEGTIEFDTCVALSASAPHTPFAVLGQTNFYDSFDCSDPSNPLPENRCLTNPSGLIVKDDKLFISMDNRIVIFEDPPFYGCFNTSNLLGETTPQDCNFDRVIGQRNVDEIIDYDLAVDGEAALSCPKGMGFKEDSLYITDSCANRITQIKNATNPTLQNCTNSSWKTSKCVFTGVLGQEDLFSFVTFEDRWDAGDFSYDSISDELIGDSDFLKRYFKHPVGIHFTENEKMIVISQEDFVKPGGFGDIALKSRLLVFADNLLEGAFPSCTDLTFNSGGCDASSVIGQRDWDKLTIVPGGVNYEDNNYTLSNVSSIDTFGDFLFLVDEEVNQVRVYNDFNLSGVTVLPDTVVLNPNGVFDNDLGRALPDLQGLSFIDIDNNKGDLIIVDGEGSKEYRIPFLRKY